MNNNRIDLSKSDKSDLEELKSDLTDSVDSKDSLNVLSLVQYFNQASNLASSVSVSAPTSPSRAGPLLPVRGASIPDLTSICPIDITMSGLETELAPFRQTRAKHKAWLTRSVNSVLRMETDGSLTLYNLSPQEVTIQERISKILSTEELISDIYDKHNVPLEDPGRVQDGDETHQFILAKQIQVAKCKEQLTLIDENPSPVVKSDVSNEVLLKALSKMNSNPTTVILECKEFYGNDNDKYNFNQWLAQLFTVIKTNPTWDDSAKLTYLKSKVKGYASNVIRPIQHGAGSFNQALDALKHHFLNKEANRDQLFNKILSISPAFCP